MLKKQQKQRRKQSINLLGIIHVQSTKNNTILTLTDSVGAPKAWCSAGSVGFKGARRATGFAAQTAAEVLAKKSTRLGFYHIDVKLKGLGNGRRSSLRGFKLGGLKIRKIQDVTPLPHNGCRQPKQRRI
jgi:small subunit ribosomal protein S11